MEKWGLALITLALPLVAAPVLWFAVAGILSGQWSQVSVEDFIPAGYELFAHDLEGRLQYGTASGFSRIASLGSLVLSLIVLIRTLGYQTGLTAFIVAAVVGALYGFWDASYGHLRPRILDDALKLAAQRWLIHHGTVARLQEAIMANTILGYAGAFALLGSFATTALRTDQSNVGEEELCDRLRARLSTFQLLSLVGAAVLVFLVLANKAQLSWLEGLLKPEPAKAFKSVAVAAGNFWGAGATVVLVCALLPVVASLRWDMELAARRMVKGTYSEQAKWRRDNALEFAPTAVVGAALAAAAPMLAGPAADIVGALLQRIAS